MNMKKILYVFAVVWLILLVSIVAVFRVKTDIHLFFLYGGFVIIFVSGLFLFQKFLEHSRWRKNFEEANRLCEEEEAKKTAVDVIPNFLTLAMVAFVAILYAVFEVVDLIQLLVANSDAEVSIDTILPQCVNVLTILICCVFIAVILYNVSNKQVFDRRNVTCIYGVGTSIIGSALLQYYTWGSTRMMPNTEVMLYYALLGAFIIFFGKLFDIAVKLKQEQDLTI